MVGKDTVQQVFESAGGKAYRIYEGINPSKGRPWCIEYNDQFTQAAPEQQLKSALDGLLPGNYTLIYTSDTRKKKSHTSDDEKEFNFYSGHKQISFTIQGNGVQGAIGAHMQPQAAPLKEGYIYISDNELKKQIKEGIENERRFWDMQRQLDEVKNSGGIGAKLIEALAPALPDIILSLTGKPAPPQLAGAIAGAKAQHMAETTTQASAPESAEAIQAANESIKQSLQQLQAHFATRGELAHKLATLAAKIDANPSLLNFL